MSLLTPQEIQVEAQKWAKRTDLPPRSHWLRELKGWILLDGRFLPEAGILHDTTALSECPEALALIPEYPAIRKTYEDAKTSLKEQIGADDPKTVDPEGYDLLSDNAKDTLHKSLKREALKAGFVLVKTNEFHILSAMGRSQCPQIKEFQDYLKAIFKKPKNP